MLLVVGGAAGWQHCLVHRMLGASRSATLVVASLMAIG